jgi:hypothetical protein
MEYLLFFNCTGCVPLNGRTFVNNESQMMWIEVAIAYFKVRTQHVPRRIEENHEKSLSG